MLSVRPRIRLDHVGSLSTIDLVNHRNMYPQWLGGFKKGVVGQVALLGATARSRAITGTDSATASCLCNAMPLSRMLYRPC